MTPSTPAWGGAPDYQGELKEEVTNLAPLAPAWHGPQNGVAIQYVAPSQPQPKEQGVLPAFWGKIESIGKETGHLIGEGASFVGHSLEDAVEAPVKAGVGLYHFGQDTYNTWSEGQRQEALESRRESIQNALKAGSITLKEYNQQMSEWSKDSLQLTKDIQNTYDSLGKDRGRVMMPIVDTAADIINVMTFGLGTPITAAGAAAVRGAVGYLGSDVAKSVLEQGAKSITKAALDKTFYDGLSSTVKQAVTDSTTQLLTQRATTMTAQKIAKTAAANMLLKYPLQYWYLNSAGTEVFNDLQNNKYGSAVNDLAFNALLLLAGGPIGHALKYGGKVLKGATGKIFGSTSFLDELSKRMGDMNPAGIYEAIKNDPEATKAFQALEATNMAATNSRVVSAVNRITSGLHDAGWGDVASMSHQDFVKQVMNWHEAQVLADDYAKGAGLSGIAVGRWTVHDANRVATALTQGDLAGTQTIADRLQAWEDFKTANKNAAFANNQNLDQQIKHLIETNDDPTKLSDEVRSIKAQFGVKGVPKRIGNKLAKMGYVVIKPVNLEAPFKQGEQKLSSEFANKGDEFFMKTVKPLPVLGSVGNFLTKMGLSPVEAEVRTNELFKANLQENLKDTSLVGHMVGETTDQTASDIMQKLSNYVYSMPTKFGSAGLKHPPIYDYRQLTLNEVQTALGIGKTDAKEVADAITRAMWDVPVSVKGMGGKLMDINYKVNPAAKYYGRYQGAFRYAWNPIFKMKLSYKGEILSQAEAGGQFPSITGTNFIMKHIFPDKYKQLGEIEQTLTSKGVFRGGYTGEAAESYGVGAGETQLTGHTTAGQRRSISGLLSTMADRTGLKVDDFVDQFPQEVRDTTEMILHYDPRNGFLQSPLARTLNMAIFPFRFNVKVATIMTKALSRQDAFTQMAVIRGMFQAANFLQSPQGQAWYSENSDVIGLFEYFTPAATLSEIAQALGQRPESVSQYGQLGGLPFGIIPSMLQAQGMFSGGQAYINPKTGAISQDYVPVNMRGRAQAAIEDFLGQIFTFPGATIGLRSKTSLGVDIAKGLVPGSSYNDFAHVTPQLTPEQQQFQQTVMRVNDILNQAKEQMKTPPQQVSSVNVPVQSSPLTTPQSKSSSRRKKKSEFTPALLPGQSQLGQL